MSIDAGDKHINFSLSQKDTLSLQHVAKPSRLKIPLMPRALKKTRLERLPLSRTNSAEIEYLGRIDTQVKIRSYRIELGEIEQVALPQVNPASLNEYASAPQFEISTISEPEAETSKLRMLKQINFKNVYK